MGPERRALGGNHGEILYGQALVAAVESEDLAQDAEFEGMDLIEEQGGDILQHAPQCGSNSMLHDSPATAGFGRNRRQ